MKVRLSSPTGGGGWGGRPPQPPASSGYPENSGCCHPICKIFAGVADGSVLTLSYRIFSGSIQAKSHDLHVQVHSSKLRQRLQHPVRRRSERSKRLVSCPRYADLRPLAHNRNRKEGKACRCAPTPLLLLIHSLTVRLPIQVFVRGPIPVTPVVNSGPAAAA
jgi:hypothetical protein